MEPESAENQGLTPSPAERRAHTSVLASELTGDLPCIGCGYNLRGLSIRALCPECQLPVRATILAIVDPKADELKALTRPRTTAWGMLLWSGAALLAALGAWAIRLDELTYSSLAIAWNPGWTWLGVLVMTGLSGVGAIVLIRPHARVPGAFRARAIVGTIAYVPLVALLWFLYARLDAGVVTPVLGAGGMSTPRIVTRLMIGAVLAIIILGLQPNARALAMRSVVVRTGRVDRQSMLALLAPVALAASGDLLQLIDIELRGPVGRTIHSAEIILVAAGSLLFTLGLFGIFIDCLRLRPIIETPGIGIADILDEDGAFR
ncbi:MAG: hypothetical protein R3B57_07305 [Phycisphaerales bacterium]